MISVSRSSLAEDLTRLRKSCQYIYMAIGGNDGGIVGGGGVGASTVLDRPPVVATGTEPVTPSVNPLSGLEDVVAAAKQEAEAVESPTTQFTEQFGSKVTPPVAEASTDTPVAPLDPSVSANDLLAKAQSAIKDIQPTAEVTPKPEQAPEEKLEELWNDIGDYLKKTRKVAA